MDNIPKPIPRPCRRTGCVGKATKRHGYCDTHFKTDAGWRDRNKVHWRKRYGKNWEKLRKKVLERDEYLCQVSLKQGRYVVATEVDHIIPISKRCTHDESNLQSICEVEHKKKTARER